MDEDAETETSDTECNSGEAAANNKYGVLYANGRLSIIPLRSSHECLQLRVHREHEAGKPILELSNIHEDLLALSDGPRVKIYNLTTYSLSCSILGTGRTVTAVSWCTNRGNVLATGCIDGSVTIWDVALPDRPIRHSKVTHGPCLALALRDHDVFATVNHDQLRVSDSKRPVVYVPAGGKTGHLAWRPGEGPSILAVACGDSLALYDTSDAVGDGQKFKQSSSSDGWDSDDDILGPFEGVPDGRQPESSALVSAVVLDTSLKSLHWVSKDALLAHSNDGRITSLFRTDDFGHGLALVCTQDLASRTSWARLIVVNSGEKLVTLCTSGIERYDLPATFFDKSSDPLPLTLQFPEAQDADSDKLAVPDEQVKIQARSASMRPMSLSSKRKIMTRLPKSAQESQPKRHPTRDDVRQTQRSPARPEHAADTLQPPSMTSSLELPRTTEYDDESRMPFLSPTIPARRSPMTVIAPLDDNVLDLPLLHQSSNGSPADPNVSVDVEDDESDDETYVDALHGSATFLPGGINVPLPKACGALFAHNGQLITFFPPRPKTAVEPLRENTACNGTAENRIQRNKGARLFPSFGNLAADAPLEIHDSDSGDSDASSADFYDMQLGLDYHIHPSSFQSQNSWQTRVSPVKASFLPDQASVAINVSVHEIEEPALHVRTERKLAHDYRILKKDSETGAAVCEHNAQCAESAGLSDVSLNWRLLSMLLENKVPLEAVEARFDDDILVVAGKRMGHFDTIENGIETSITPDVKGLGHLRWASNPLGSSWLIRKIFCWAEQRADVQLLASMAAVLTMLEPSKTETLSRAERGFLEEFPTWSTDYMANAASWQPTVQEHPQLLSKMHRSPVTSNTRTSLERYSPSKQHRTSSTSSRNASQPATPYLLDSLSATPPLSLPSMSRQGSRLSASGSASPEAHRSSFSAAAKYYAQSITDKFAAYGTSPPMRKSGLSVSPSNNELSTSLPTGTWTKSVSFATSLTNAAAGRGSLLSQSLDEKEYDDAYDSDRTIEDSSLPHTPRGISGDIVVTQKNSHAFPDDISGGARQPLLPADLVIKARFWCQYYANQLRLWGMLEKATEMEKVYSSQGNPAYPNRTPKIDDYGVTPSHSPRHAIVDCCVICSTMLGSLEQLCPHCLHASHISCLIDYANALGGNGFACPTGCGCNCSGLQYLVQDLRPVSPVAKPSFKKKPSFTDPRRWRARIDGDSW